MRDRSHLLTEQRLAASMQLDQLTVAEAVDLFNQENRRAVEAVAAQSAGVAEAVVLVAAALRRGGRLIYVGAGSSGRLGVLDAAECPPTFSSDPDRILGVLAGGPPAMFRAQENIEDQPDAGAAEMARLNVGAADAVMGIAAGGTTPFVHGALAEARRRGASTLYFCCVPAADNEPQADVYIRPLTGPEILTGSTRLKAATATKLVLNTISTLAMVQLGKVYENLMVDLRAANEKLRDRAARIVATVCNLPADQARDLLLQAGGQVKVAIVMRRCNLPAHEAEQLLQKHHGHLRHALA